jgi:hypothetical protein
MVRLSHSLIEEKPETLNVFDNGEITECYEQVTEAEYSISPPRGALGSLIFD